MTWETDKLVRLGPVEAFDREPTVVEMDGKEIAVFRRGNEVHAIRNVCPHQHGPVGRGVVDKEFVYCPWHGWKFDVETGENPIDDRKRVLTYETVVRDGEVFVRA